MATAKDIVIKPISIQDANAIVRRLHYSGKVTNNSQLNFGVFLHGRCEGAMQFGPPMDRSKVVGLVAGTPWNGFIELNRMAFGPALPKNSESRAMAVAFKIIRKKYPQIEWVLSFSDATQCGDGAIYRAAGFVLTAIKRNTQIIEFPDGFRATRLVLTNTTRTKRAAVARRYGITLGSGSSLKPFLDYGAKFLPGFQLRYIYFLNPEARRRLTVAEIPFSKIQELGASMYLGKSRAGSKANVATGFHPVEGGVTPTPALQLSKAANDG